MSSRPAPTPGRVSARVQPAAATRTSAPRQAAATGKQQSLTASKPAADQWRYDPPIECKTWYKFKQQYTDKYLDERTSATYTTSEQLGETKQALAMLDRAIQALERDIKTNVSSDPSSQKQRTMDQRGLAEFRKDKRGIEDVLRQVSAIQAQQARAKPAPPSNGANQRRNPSGLDSQTMRIINGLDESRDNMYAERQRNKRSGKKGLVDGVQILDDATQDLIEEYNQKFHLSGGNSKK